MVRSIVIVLMFLCAACGSGKNGAPSPHPSWGPAVILGNSPVPDIAESHFGPKLTTEQECQTANGSWGIVGESTAPRCIVPTSDGGALCTDHAQCQGLCIAGSDIELGQPARGTCATTYYEMECHTWVFNGRAERRVCLD